MATLKQHQAAMVNLLANGTAIPTSAVRLAHALHDVLAYINGAENAPEAHTERRSEATTSGLNDAALAYDVAAVRPKRSSAEQQIAMLNNTIRQLRESNAKLRNELADARRRLDLAEHEIECVRIAFDPDYVVAEQAGCRKEDTQSSEVWFEWYHGARAPEPHVVVEIKTECGARVGPFMSKEILWDTGRDYSPAEYRIVGESK